MRFLFCLIIFAFVCNCTAQRIEHFYDYEWKPSEVVNARFYSLIENKDSVWQRQDYFIKERVLQMRGTFRDSSCKIHHGKFTYYHPNKRLESTGSYVNGKKQGLWLSYYSNGMMADSTVYENGNPVGTSLGWHSNGYPSDSAVYNVDGSGIKVSWFDNGAPSSAGKYAAGHRMHGKWQFFHKNGQKSALETYDNGKLINKEYFNEEGVSETDATGKDKEASFVAGGAQGWHKYIQKQLYFPTQYKIQNTDKVVVVVDAVINEEGKVTDAEVSVPFFPAFDRIALDAVQRSPKWNPAMSHNRKVKYKIRQAVTFSQLTE